jgi:hypothetical protein
MNIERKIFERKLRPVEVWPHANGIPELRIVVACKTFRKYTTANGREVHFRDYSVLVVGLSIAKFFRKATRCFTWKKAFLSRETQIDFCEVQKKLIERRRGKKLGMNADIGENSTVQEW